MVTCPWCGTNYLEFQSNCKNCGGPLEAVYKEASRIPPSGDRLSAPPPAPRPISDRYTWHLLLSDGWAVAAFIVGFLGAVFTLVGAGLILGFVTAFVGIPFLLVGLLLVGAACMGGAVRYGSAKKVVAVLRSGQAAAGQVMQVDQDVSVRVNGRSPWVIRYRFQVNGLEYDGKVSTFNQPGHGLQSGGAVWVLYLPEDPKWNSIYPHP